MALPLGRATFFDAPCGARRRGAGIGRYFRRSGAPGVFSEFRTTGSVFGVQDHRECFRSSGVSGRKMCCGAPETLRSEEGFGSGAPERKICCGAPKTSQSGASVGKVHADTPKGSEMNVKMTEVGHMGRKHSLMPRRMI